MENKITLPQAHPLERETEYEANRLMEHIQNALSAVAVRSPDDGDSIEAAADRIERVSHDLVFALRELARDRTDSEES
jgi:hypothetical protein